MSSSVFRVREVDKQELLQGGGYLPRKPLLVVSPWTKAFPKKVIALSIGTLITAASLFASAGPSRWSLLVLARSLIRL